MCLTKAKKYDHNKDITCYKVVEVNKNGERMELRSPFRYKKTWRIGRTEVIPTKRRNLVLCHLDGGYGKVFDGAYHSFAKLSDAKIIAEAKSNNKRKRSYKVMECIIPKNSAWTYRGEFRHHMSSGDACMPSFASQKLKPIRMIEE